MQIKDFIPSFFNFDKPQPKSQSAISAIKFEQQLQRVRQDATKFKMAVTSAESTMYPNRFLLMQAYQQAILDGQIQSALLQRKMKVLGKKFHLIKPDGECDEEKTKLLNQRWFYDFLDLALDSIPYGFSAIQFSPVKNSKFLNVELIPRIYVVPEFDLVRSNTATITEGIKFTEKPYSNWCIGVGKKRDLGLLMKLTPYAIWKNNAFGAWAEFAEVFGVPLRVARTDVRDETTRKNAENMMRNMGVATWSVLDLADQFEIIEASRTDSFNVFDKMIERCNGEISKIILGQTGTTDERSYSGSSLVHKDVAEQIGRQDQLLMQFIVNDQLIPMIGRQDQLLMQFIVNDQLIPMMNGLGFDLADLRFEFDQSESLTIEQQAKIDASFMPYVKFENEYLEKKYNIEINEVEEDIEESSISTKLKNLYK